MCLSISSLPAHLAMAATAGLAPARREATLPLPDWVQGLDRVEDDLDAMAIRWLGTAGFEVRTPRASVLFDPYFTRDSLWRLLRGPLKSDPERVEPHLRPAQAVFIGHAHFDHLLDAPAIARRLGATLHASEDALRIARAEGLDPALTRALRGGDRLTIGDLDIEVIKSEHSPLITQALVGGPVPERVKTPLWFHEYKCGPVWAFLIRWRGRTVLHCGSARLLEPELADRHADLALFCLNGWKTDPYVFQLLNRTLAPRVVVPMHHDDFFRPFSEGLKVGPLVHEAAALAAIRRDMPQASVVPLDFFEAIRLDPLEAT